LVHKPDSHFQEPGLFGGRKPLAFLPRRPRHQITQDPLRLLRGILPHNRAESCNVRSWLLGLSFTPSALFGFVLPATPAIDRIDVETPISTDEKTGICFERSRR
jgi:hypothetical protein